jgi:hypothetical protein
MATYEQLMEGARKADAAGDTAGARRFLELARDNRQPQRSSAEGTAEMNKMAEQAMAQTIVDENPVGARAVKFSQGLHFVGQYVDEAYGAIGGDNARNKTREMQQAMDTARPVESAAWELGGGVTGAVAGAPVLGPVAGAIGSIGGLGLRTAAGLAAGATGGAVEGAVSGYGAGNEGDRVASAGRNALTGGAVGGVLGAAAPLAGAGAKALYGRLKGRDVAAIASELGISRDAAKAVKASIDADGMTGNALRNPDAMLLEAGQSTRDLGDAVAQTGGKAGAIMKGAVDERAAKGAADVNAAMNGAFGSPAARAKPDLSGVYDKAYRTPVDYSTREGMNIERLAAKVPKSEFARARKLIEMDPNIPDDIKKQALISIGADGSLKKGTLPSTLELDYVTRALNDVAKGGDGKGALGGNTNEGRIYGNLSNAIRANLRKVNPAYGRALDQASTEIGIKEAGEFGATVLRPNVTRAEVVERLAKAPKVERDAAKEALRQSIDDTLANTKRLMTRPDTNVGEAIKAVKDLTTRASRAKLATVLGRDAAEKLLDEVDRSATAFEIQAAMAGNSRTAVRQAVQGSVDQSTAPGSLSKLLAGEPLQAGKRLAQIFTGKTPEAQEAAKAGIYEDIARALTQKRGPEAERALMGIQRAMAGQALTDAQARRIADVTVTALTAGGYPAGTQALRTQTQSRQPTPAR